MSFVNRFLNAVFEQFQKNTEDRILRKTQEVYGKLLRIGGTKIVSIMERDVKETTKWVKIKLIIIIIKILLLLIYI